MWFVMVTLCYVHMANPMVVMCNSLREKPIRYFNTEETCMQTRDDHRVSIERLAAKSKVKIVVFNFECKIMEEDA